MIRLLFSLFLIVALAGCSQEQFGSGDDKRPTDGSNPDGNDDSPTTALTITTGAMPAYSRNQAISIPIISVTAPMDNDILSFDVFKNSNCTGSPDDFVNAYILTEVKILDVNLTPNSTNAISVRANFVSGDKSDCVFIKEIIHDDVAPPVPSVAQTNHSITQTSIHIPILNLPSDAKTINFYSDGNLFRSVVSSLWANNLGYVPLNSGETIQFHMTVVDNAGNESGYSPLITVSHSSSSVAKPNITSLDGHGSRDGILLSSNSLNVTGIIPSDQTFAVFQLPDNLTPILTGTSEELLSGFDLSLSDGAMTSFNIVAVNSSSERSDPFRLRASYVSSPSFRYEVNPSVLAPNVLIKPNTPMEVTIAVQNNSIEQNTSARIPVTSFEIVSSHAGVAIDNSKGCPITGISASGSCDLYATINLPNGEHLIDTTITLNGVEVPKQILVDVKDPILFTLPHATKLSLGAFRGKEMNNKFIGFKDGAMSLDGSDIVISPDSSIDFGQALIDSLFLYDAFFGINNGRLLFLSDDTTLSSEDRVMVMSTPSLKFYESHSLPIEIEEGSEEDIEIPSLNINYLGSNNCNLVRSEDVDTDLNTTCIDGVASVGNEGFFVKTSTGYNRISPDLANTSSFTQTILGEMFTFNGNSYASTNSGIVELKASSTDIISPISGTLIPVSSGVFIVSNISSGVFYHGNVFSINGSITKDNIFNTYQDTTSLVDMISANTTTFITTTKSLVDYGMPSSSTAREFPVSSSVGDVGGLFGTEAMVVKQDGPQVIAIQADDSSILYSTPVANGTLKGGFANASSMAIAVIEDGELRVKVINSGTSSHQVTQDYVTISDANLSGDIKLVAGMDGNGILYYETASSYEVKIIAIH